MKLNLGSGREPLNGYVNLDLNPNAPKVDIVGPAYPLPFVARGRLWEAIRAVDVLEHLGYRETERALREWCSVLEPGGTLFVQVPDGLEIARWLVDDDPRLLERLPAGVPHTLEGGAAWRLFGGQDDGTIVQAGENPDFNLHRTLFSAVSLRRSLECCGFTDITIETNPHPNLIAKARRA